MTGDGTVVFRGIEPGMSAGYKLPGIRKGEDTYVSIRTHEISHVNPFQGIGGTFQISTTEDIPTHVQVSCSITYGDGSHVDFNSVEIPIGCKMKAKFVDETSVEYID